MENLSYFNLNSTEDCGERGRVASFIASTFDQCFLSSFVPSGIRETGIFCVAGYELLINGSGPARVSCTTNSRMLWRDAGCQNISAVLQRVIA